MFCHITGGIYRLRKTNTERLNISTRQCEIRHQRKLFVLMKTMAQTLPIMARDAQVIQLRLAIEKMPHINGWLNTNSKVEYAKLPALPKGSLCSNIPRQNISSNQGLINAKSSHNEITSGLCSSSKFISRIDNGIRPTHKESSSQPILPTGFWNNAFIPFLPSSLRLSKKVVAQYNIASGIKTHSLSRKLPIYATRAPRTIMRNG